LHSNGVVYFWCMTIEELYQLYRAANNLVCTDTRNIIPGSIFFALKGANFNGNSFANEALNQGCKYAVVDESPEKPHTNIVVVPNVLLTMQQLATHHRRQFDIPVIGLTGSNGKTTTKELMAAVLSSKFKVHATAGNLNNHIGVPLTLLSMPLNTQVAIIEMGANQPNDIGELCQIAEPTHGLITNIGRAHLEGFGSVKGIMRAKGQLFDFIRSHGGEVFVHISDPVVKEMASGIPQFTYSSDDQPADVSGKIASPELQVKFEWSTANQSANKVQTQLTGGYNLPNLLAAVSLGVYFQIEDAAINAALSAYTPKNNRSQIQKTAHNTLILDAYNANPSSMEKALRDFAAIPVRGGKMVILGDMLELGQTSTAEHMHLISLLGQLEITGILVGREFCAAAKQVQSSIPTFEATAGAREHLKSYSPKNTNILIKGSRGIQLEKLVDLL